MEIRNSRARRQERLAPAVMKAIRTNAKIMRLARRKVSFAKSIVCPAGWWVRATPIVQSPAQNARKAKALFACALRLLLRTCHESTQWIAANARRSGKVMAIASQALSYRSKYPGLKQNVLAPFRAS